MAIIAMASGSGSPGVTTMALGLALTWPRSVVVIEADPSGSNGLLAGHFRGTSQASDGLYELVMAGRNGDIAGLLPLVAMPVPQSRVMVVPGIRSPEQAWTLDAFWPLLLPVLRDLESTGQDVIVDVGRLGLAGSASLLFTEADLALLVTRSHLPALAGARPWAAMLRESFAAIAGGDRLGLLVIGPGRPYSSRNIADAVGLPAVASVGWDPDCAGVLSMGASRPRWRYGRFIADVRSAGDAVRTLVDSTRRGTRTEVIADA